MLKNNRLSLFMAIGWSVTLTILLVLPGSAFPSENWMSRIQLDKIVHIVFFFLLVFLWVTALIKLRQKGYDLMKTCLYTAVLAVLYGIAMEFVQKYFVINRAFELNDIFADTAGAVIGSLFSLRRYIKK